MPPSIGITHSGSFKIWELAGTPHDLSDFIIFPATNFGCENQVVLSFVRETYCFCGINGLNF